MKKKQFFLQFFVALLITGVLIMARGFDLSASKSEIVKNLSDGFAAIGILYLCFGGLSMIGATGMYDIFGYGFKVGSHAIFPNFNREEMPKDFYDYKVKKTEKRKKRPMSMVMFVGALYLLIGIIFTMIWYQIEG